MTNSNLVSVFDGKIATQSVQLANARELHSFLEIKTRFDDWIKNRITDYGFIQDEDYIIVTERTNGRPRKEYHITLDMGKELAMVERNEKGRQIRKYFIACEKRALQNPSRTYRLWKKRNSVLSKPKPNGYALQVAGMPFTTAWNCSVNSTNRSTHSVQATPHK